MDSIPPKPVKKEEGVDVAAAAVAADSKEQAVAGCRSFVPSKEGNCLAARMNDGLGSRSSTTQDHRKTLVLVECRIDRRALATL